MLLVARKRAGRVQPRVVGQNDGAGRGGRRDTVAEPDCTQRVIVSYYRGWSSDDASVGQLIGEIDDAVPGITVIGQREYDEEADAASERMAVLALEMPVEEIKPALREFGRRHGDRRYHVRHLALWRDCQRRQDELERAANTDERVRLLVQAATDYGVGDCSDSALTENPRTQALRMGRSQASLYWQLYERAVARDPAIKGRAPSVPMPRDWGVNYSLAPELAEVVSVVAPAATGVLVDRLTTAAVGWFRRRRRTGDELRVVRIYGPSGRLLREVEVPDQADEG